MDMQKHKYEKRETELLAIIEVNTFYKQIYNIEFRAIIFIIVCRKREKN